MILVPFVVGLALTLPYRPLDVGDLTLGLTWLIGYFAFNAVVLYLKAAPKRRGRYVPAAATYGAIAGVLGLLTLWVRGWSLLWWTPLYAILLGTALWLAASKRERSLLSGILTVVASCGLMVVLRGSAGVDFVRADEVAVMLAVTAYFVGTVFHVKALIRERNDPASARRSLVLHVALALAVSAAVAVGWLHWAWLPWALAIVARSIWLPGKPRRPALIGVVEIALSAWALALALVT